MANFTIETNVLTHIYGTSKETGIGQSSNFVDTPHPGTNKKIEGWKWDQRYWPTIREFEASELVPSLWDPKTDKILEQQYQSGYGDNHDLLLLSIENKSVLNQHIWAPKINHGWFYTYDEEWYLFSDSFLTEYFTTTGIETGAQVLTLTHNYKPTIPIQVRRWKFDSLTGRYSVDKDFRKVTTFSSDPDGPEFIVNTSLQPPKLILDDDYTEVIGSPITLTSGLADTTLVSGLELVGTSKEIADQEFYLDYSPIAPDANIEVWTWLNPSTPIAWSGITPATSFTDGESYEVKIDKDRGSIKFGNFGIESLTGGGKIPPYGYKIGVHYTKGLAAMYEPIHSRDYLIPYNNTADTNPINTSTSTGFLYVTTESIEPAKITLTSTLPRINPYIINLGNSVGELIATVSSLANTPIEGQEVTFQILDPSIGTFGGNITSTTAITDANGEARVFYSAPTTISDVGRASNVVTQNGNTTIIDVNGLVDPGTISGLFLYKIHEYDEILGINEDNLAQYYTDYLTEIGATEGTQGTTVFEQEFRTNNSLLSPTTYPSTDLSTGKKTIVLTKKLGTINPHSGVFDSDIYSPLYPEIIEDTGTSDAPALRLTYSGLLDLPGSNGTKAYFVVGETITDIQAHVTNQRTKQELKSNQINMSIQLPPTSNGTYFATTLNAVANGLLTRVKDVDTISDADINSTSGIDNLYGIYISERNYDGTYETYADWFRRTRRGDTVGLNQAAVNLGITTLSGLDIVDLLDAPGEIPLGFRLKSSGITIASILDQVTFLDPNDNLPSGYYNI
jgi:hypothetical protein